MIFLKKAVLHNKARKLFQEGKTPREILHTLPDATFINFRHLSKIYPNSEALRKNRLIISLNIIQAIITLTAIQTLPYLGKKEFSFVFIFYLLFFSIMVVVMLRNSSATFMYTLIAVVATMAFSLTTRINLSSINSAEIFVLTISIASLTFSIFCFVKLHHRFLWWKFKE